MLRNALLPVVTLAGVHSGTLIGGAVLTETVFAWPGIGRLMYEALLQRDYNLLLGVFVVCSAMVLIFNLDHRPGLPPGRSAHRIRHMKQFWKSMLRNPGGMIGLVILVIAILIAVFGPWLFPNSPWRMVQRPFLPPFTLAKVPLGTDALGRDVFAGIIYGARVSLLVGLVSTLVALAVGVPLGAIAGYFGGRIDDALMRFTEFFQTIPSFALAIVLVAILQPSIYSIVASIAIVSWPPVARLVRGEVLSLRTREYVQAAIVTGQTHSWIIWREILPNALSPVIVLASLMVATAILLESSLSFLGPWRSQPDLLGLHGRRRAHRGASGVVDHGISRLRHSALGARPQPDRRRPQRRAQPASRQGRTLRCRKTRRSRSRTSKSRCRRAANAPTPSTAFQLRS